MQRRLGIKYQSLIFIILFSILILYQDQYIISKNHFLDAFRGFQNASSNAVNNKAYVQSYGFFDGISNANWELYRDRYQSQHRHMDNDVRNRRNYINVNHQHHHHQEQTEQRHDEHNPLINEDEQQNAHLFYRDNYDAEFTCLNQVQMGVTHDHNPKNIDHQTPKMLCDPNRILASGQERVKLGGNGCLIYIFDEGSGDPSQFWRDMNEELGENCEIHGFSPHWDEDRLRHLQKEVTGKYNIGLHPWGLEGDSKSHLGRNNYLTLGETLTELGHVGHTIDVVSLDCDGCEWEAYQDILHSDSVFTQLLIELHGAPYQVNDFFLEMKQHGYVVFHKETNIVEKGGGQNHAYSLVRLAPAFFEPTHSSSSSNPTPVAKDFHMRDGGHSVQSSGKIRRVRKHQRIPRHTAQYNTESQRIRETRKNHQRIPKHIVQYGNY